MSVSGTDVAVQYLWVSSYPLLASACVCVCVCARARASCHVVGWGGVGVWIGAWVGVGAWVDGWLGWVGWDEWVVGWGGVGGCLDCSASYVLFPVSRPPAPFILQLPVLRSAFRCYSGSAALIIPITSGPSMTMPVRGAAS